MTHTTKNASTSNATEMGNGNKKLPLNSFSADNLPKYSSKSINNKDVAKWSSHDVQHWIKQQCKKFELKKATVEKFEMNGQALVLLTKHDFLRRSPDGGEILYYALQRLINPNKVNSIRLDQSASKNGSSGQHPRIVEVNGDYGLNDATDSSSPKPIIEEPDDPPIIRRSQSDTNPQGHHQQQQLLRPFFFNPALMQPPVFTMDAGSAAAYFHQQRGFPNTSMYAHHHPHLHMHQQHFVHPHFIHQYHPMMFARGILIEFMDDVDLNNPTLNGVNGAHESLYRVTVNGQRYVMTEDQVRQFLTEVHQRQNYQENLQQQQQFQQQLQFFQQQAQQQHF